MVDPSAGLMLMKVVTPSSLARMQGD